MAYFRGASVLALVMTASVAMGAGDAVPRSVAMSPKSAALFQNAGHHTLVKSIGHDGTAIGVELDQRALAAMSLEPLATVEAFPLSDGRLVTLQLERFEVLTPDARVVHVNDDGTEVAMPRPDVRMWQGMVSGDPDSVAFLAVSSDIGVNGYVRTQGKTFIMSSGVAGMMPTVIHELGAIPVAAGPAGGPVQQAICDGAILPPGQAPLPAQREAGERGAWTCKRFTVAVDCDTEFTSDLFSGNTAAAQAYVAVLFGAVTSIYQVDVDIRLDVSFLRTWGANDPYTQTGTCTQLNQLASYWNANQGGTPRATTHLLSGRGLGGGCAFLASLCNGNAYGVSANLGGGFPLPLSSNNGGNWDVYVTAHEIGHNFGTGHTHEIGSYNPIIDGCGNGDCSQAAQGTIMSYCHQCSGGISNIALTFGPRVQSAIRAYVDGGVPGCGTALPSFSQQPTPLNVSEGDPAILNATAIGLDAGTYQWKRNNVNVTDNARISGATTSQIIFTPALVSDAGNYTVSYTSPDCGTVNSVSVALSVAPACTLPNVPPTIVDQPDPLTINRGLVANFNVAATDSGSISYQWRKGVTPLVNSATISGATSPSLSISNVQTSSNGLYNVVVTGPQCHITSVFATLEVIATPEPFALSYPADGATGIPRNPLFEWATAIDATGYTITVDDNSNFASPLLSFQTLQNTLFTQPNTLQPATTYYWKVIATNQYGQATSIPAMATFVTFIPPPPACPGDANSDNLVNAADLSVMLGQFGGPPPPEFSADFNGDGIINAADLSVLLSAFGSSCNP